MVLNRKQKYNSQTERNPMSTYFICLYFYVFIYLYLYLFMSSVNLIAPNNNFHLRSDGTNNARPLFFQCYPVCLPHHSSQFLLQLHFLTTNRSHSTHFFLLFISSPFTVLKKKDREDASKSFFFSFYHYK